MKISLILTAVLGLLGSRLSAQITVYDPKRIAERSVENRVNNRVNQGVDKSVDKVEEGLIGIFKKKPKDKPAEAPPSEKPSEKQRTTGNDATAAESGERGGKGTATAKTPSLQAYSKFDFVPGSNVLAIEDFAQDATGDFPSRWNTNATGEVVTVNGQPGRYLMLTKEGAFLPEFMTTLPDNFTLEFDLICNEDFNFYSNEIAFVIAALEQPGKEFTQWTRFGRGPEGVRVAFHPTNAGNTAGSSAFSSHTGGHEVMKNEVASNQFWTKRDNHIRVSVWRQRQRLRVYANEEKLWDLPRAFQPDVKYNTVLFQTGTFHQETDRYLIGNLRLAVGAPDTRNKLLTEGKFVTTGILFDVNSAHIRPESYGTLKAIAGVLTETADLRVRIVGHTDADGDDAQNLSLSKKRGEAVKAALAAEFGIDKNRLETDGLGETQPAAPNTTPEGKANNRRVEFIKL